MRYPALALLCLGFPVFSAADEPVPNLSGMVDIGYISSMGTTSGSKDTFRGKVMLTNTGEYWINIFSGEGISVRDEYPATNDTEHYLLNYKARHYLNPLEFFTFRGQWEKDLLSASEYQAFVSLGLGRELIKTDHHFLKIELGPGVRHTEWSQAATENNAMGLLSWDYDWKISDVSRFTHKGTVESAEDSTVTRISNQFRQNVTKVIGMTVNHDYRYEHGSQNKREGIFTFGINYQFQ
ncbi:putative salt-induced outer membrane protein YdiY [Fluviicoccus keumensis]|uniref:Putative salt-induced outer membrane protein YdiY n=2 Tax=Fluviicoccus keumensis TaxID=1435465 RepID=A0A4Q7Z6C2_9GAMM|nr:putative salt-induced outer membrane protein YdiY [Fluviicoccus keumensis]